ncbi:MAG: hypothetical protein HYU36_22220 [Planctomycetes bacterium]|nr:hypothetical protein [Planctomycetota bacterium]
MMVLFGKLEQQILPTGFYTVPALSATPQFFNTMIDDFELLNLAGEVVGCIEGLRYTAFHCDGTLLSNKPVTEDVRVVSATPNLAGLVSPPIVGVTQTQADGTFLDFLTKVYSTAGLADKEWEIVERQRLRVDGRLIRINRIRTHHSFLGLCTIEVITEALLCP